MIEQAEPVSGLLNTKKDAQQTWFRNSMINNEHNWSLF